MSVEDKPNPVFNPDWVKTYDPEKEPPKGNLVMLCVDPATAESKTVRALVSVEPDGTRKIIKVE